MEAVACRNGGAEEERVTRVPFRDSDAHKTITLQVHARVILASIGTWCGVVHPHTFALQYVPLLVHKVGLTHGPPELPKHTTQGCK